MRTAAPGSSAQNASSADAHQSPGEEAAPPDRGPCRRARRRNRRRAWPSPTVTTRSPPDDEATGEQRDARQDGKPGRVWVHRRPMPTRRDANSAAPTSDRERPPLRAHRPGVTPECRHLLQHRLERIAPTATGRPVRRDGESGCARPLGAASRSGRRAGPARRPSTWTNDSGAISTAATSAPRPRTSTSASTIRSSSSGVRREHERLRRQRVRRDHADVAPHVREDDLGVEQRLDDPVELHGAHAPARAS